MTGYTIETSHDKPKCSFLFYLFIHVPELFNLHICIFPKLDSVVNLRPEHTLQSQIPARIHNSDQRVSSLGCSRCRRFPESQYCTLQSLFMDFLLYPDPAMLQWKYVQATAIAASTIV